MLLKLLKSNKKTRSMEINQANIFYNYSLGFQMVEVDLIKTASKILKSGFSKSIFFSDFKCLYIDDLGKVQVKILEPEGRNWDSNWKVNFDGEMPNIIKSHLIESFDIAFHEYRIMHDKILYLRACLPPLILEDEYGEMPLFASVKIYENGIAMLSFQFDATWDGIGEDDFISNIVNLYQRYFRSIWIDSKIQKVDAEVILNGNFEENFSFAGVAFKDRKIKKIIKNTKKRSREVLDRTLKDDGRTFTFEDESCVLYPVAGTNDKEDWESTLELCRSMYSNVISDLIVPKGKPKNSALKEFMWQGRPSISLFRFEGQPEKKKELLDIFSFSLMKILTRMTIGGKYTDLPGDLRVFEDYCLHADRSGFLWTWLKSADSPENIWDDPNAWSKLFENQARAEQVEYYNMVIARACSWAHDPLSDSHLLNAYEILANSEQLIYHSSNSDEIAKSISFLLKEIGTTNLIDSAKEVARFHLDELKYESDTARNRSSYWLTFIFGFVGVTSFAEFAVHSFVQQFFPVFGKIITPIMSFGIAIVLLLLVVVGILEVNKRR